jgi:glycosyltransferase involved in cell wall biosynthesis
LNRRVARIALVCEPPDGGVAQHVRQLALGVPEHGYEPVLLVPPEFVHLEELRAAGREVRTLSFRRDYAHPHQDARALAALVPVLRGCALVHSHSAKAGVLGRVAARLARRPAVYTPHGFPFVGEMSGARRRFGVVVERALAPLTAALVCVCEFERGLARAEKLRARRLAVVHNGCPPCPGVPVVPLPDGLVIGAVSTLRPAKALDVLLDAMPAVLAAVPDAKLVIAGGGPLEAELRAQAERLDLDVAWLPYEAPPARYLRGFDVYVLSSAWEAFPIGPLEAQACGVPQVVTAVGGTRESVVPETGLLVPPRDPPALARALIELLRDPARRATMSDASRARHAAHFTVEKMVAGTAAVYDAVLADRRPAMPEAAGAPVAGVR